MEMVLLERVLSMEIDPYGKCVIVWRHLLLKSYAYCVICSLRYVMVAMERNLTGLFRSIMIIFHQSEIVKEGGYIFFKYKISICILL